MAVTSVYNHDILGFYNRINKFIEEVMKSQSSNLSEVNDFDKNRLRSYLSAMRFYHDQVQSAPDLDLPETTPRLYDLREKPVVPDMENESCADICRLFEILRDEMINSQSARRGAKLVSFDSARLIQVISKVESFLSNYVDVATPLDLPESAPRATMTGEGRKGI
jgi:glycyl-tRNA synthetase beta subunit